MRGRVVTLGPSLDAILQRHDFPVPVKRLVGEAAVLASLLATSLKDVGRFILQTQTDGPVSMIVVDVRTPGQIRATATLRRGGRGGGDGRTAAPTRRSCSARGTLAMTVEQGQTQQRYQGYVPLEDGDARGGGAHLFPPVGADPDPHPPRRRRDVRPRRGGRGAPHAGGRAASSASSCRARRSASAIATCRRATCRRARSAAPEPQDDDAWVEAQALIDTVEDHELTDPSIAAERLLYRLFHERGVRVFEPISLEENCSCSRERIEQVLAQMSAGGDRGGVGERLDRGALRVLRHALPLRSGGDHRERWQRLALYVRLEARERVVPLPRDFVEIVARVGKRLRLQLEQSFRGRCGRSGRRQRRRGREGASSPPAA